MFEKCFVTELKMVLVLTVTLASCQAPLTEPQPQLNRLARSGVFFVAQAEKPLVYFDALVSGVIAADAAGCLRIGDSGAPTVIWPHGYRLGPATSHGIDIVDAAGVRAGSVGGRFTLGGGEVRNLDGISIAAADRRTLETKCPGIYWVASPDEK